MPHGESDFLQELADLEGEEGQGLSRQQPASDCVSGRPHVRTQPLRRRARSRSSLTQRCASARDPPLGLRRRPMSGPSLHAGAGLGEPRQPLGLAAGGARPEGAGIGAPAAPASRGRVRGLAAAAGAGLARSRGGVSRWRRRRRRLAVGRRRGLRLVRWGIGSFWILYPVF